MKARNNPYLKRPIKAFWRTSLYAQMSLRSALIAGRHPASLDATVKAWLKENRRDSIRLVLGAGLGNIGDDAMLDRLITHDQDPAVILIPEAHSVLDLDKDPFVSHLRRNRNNRFLVLPGQPFLSMNPVVRFNAHRQFGALCSYADSFEIIGADTMDGGNESQSLTRFDLLAVATSLGLRTRVYGFSWRAGVPSPIAKRMADTARTTQFVLRDPASAERIQDDGALDILQAADLVFGLQATEQPNPDLVRWVASTATTPVRFAIVNVSGLVSKSVDPVPEYGAVVDALHQAGLRVLFLPHVIREADSDLPAVRAVFDAYANQDDYLVEELLTPRQVAWITGRSEIVITGRMHLAILSIKEGRTPIVLSTAGKVRGMLQLFDLETLAVEPDPGFGQTLTEKVGVLLPNIERFRTRMKEQLPGVRVLSDRNFAEG